MQEINRWLTANNLYLEGHNFSAYHPRRETLDLFADAVRRRVYRWGCAHREYFVDIPVQPDDVANEIPIQLLERLAYGKLVYINTRKLECCILDHLRPLYPRDSAPRIYTLDPDRVDLPEEGDLPRPLMCEQAICEQSLREALDAVLDELSQEQIIYPPFLFTRFVVFEAFRDFLCEQGSKKGFYEQNPHLFTQNSSSGFRSNAMSELHRWIYAGMQQRLPEMPALGDARGGASRGVAWVLAQVDSPCMSEARPRARKLTIPKSVTEVDYPRLVSDCAELRKVVHAFHAGCDFKEMLTRLYGMPKDCATYNPEYSGYFGQLTTHLDDIVARLRVSLQPKTRYAVAGMRAAALSGCFESAKAGNSIRTRSA